MAGKPGRHLLDGEMVTIAEAAEKLGTPDGGREAGAARSGVRSFRALRGR